MVQLSVIIPTYNRAAALRLCLDLLLRQTQPTRDFEIIVVIDGSTDDSREMLASFRNAVELRVLEQPNSGPAAARNRGAVAAKGDTCLFLDDDMLAAPQLVAEHIALQRARGSIVGLGQIVPASLHTKTFFSCHQRTWNEHYTDLQRAEVSPDFRDCYGGNLAVPRSAFLQVGGFAEDLPRGHDIELGFRLKKQGLSFAYAPGATTLQCDSKSFHELTSDWEKSGVAGLEIYRRHPATLPHMKLGAFGRASLRETILRRLFLAWRVPPRMLGLLFPLLKSARLQVAWYSFVHNYCYWRGVRRSVAGTKLWQRLVRGPVILCYHAVGSADAATGRYLLPVSRFVRQMYWLRNKGYQVLSLEDILNCRREYRLPPARSVVITFDDGYVDGRTLAYPILKRCGFSATFFLVTGHVGDANRWSSNLELKCRPLLSWTEVREMQTHGANFGSHTQSHGTLLALSPAEVDRELMASREELERELGSTRIALAYPYGDHDASTETAAERAGYTCGLGVEEGIDDQAVPTFSLRRTEIYGTDSLYQFALGIWLGKVPRRTMLFGRGPGH